MADGIQITEGVGKTVATDDMGATGHAQIMKIADGTNGGTTPVPADADRGLLVNPARRLKRVQVTPTISTSAYTSLDQLGDIMAITNASRISGGGGILRAVTIMCKANVSPTMVLRFFDRSVTLAADNAAASTSDADRAYQVADLIVAAGNWSTSENGNGNQFAQIPAPTGAATSYNLSLPYICNATTLYCAAMITSASTFASTTDLVFSFVYEQD